MDTLLIDAVLCILVGLGTGSTTSKLMTNSGDRLISGTVAGVVGALLGGLSMRLLDPAAQVNTVVAGLAGALWLTWVVCVVTFGRPSDDVLSARVNNSAHLASGRDMLTYETC